jgi:alkylhydroperoxidase family enzyme
MSRIAIPEDVADPTGHAFGLVPAVGASAAAYSLAVYQHCRLSLRELEGARFRTAQINGCHVCQRFRASRDLAAHVERSGGTAGALALKTGDPPDEAFYASVPHWRTAPGLSVRERLVIELAERMGERPQSMENDEDFWQRLHAAFTDVEIVDATLAIASWLALGRVVHTLELDTVCLPTFDQHAA